MCDIGYLIAFIMGLNNKKNVSRVIDVTIEVKLLFRLEID